MKTGTVKWFSGSKGYGMIRSHDGSGDVAVFYPSIEAEGFKMLAQGQQVTYECAPTALGRRTIRVVPS